MNGSPHQDVIEQIRSAAHALHAAVAQTYDGDKPYAVHLDMVADRVMNHAGDLPVPDNDLVPVMFGAYYHDSIEDARLTYNNVLQTAARFMDSRQARLAAEIVYALTNDKGRTRAERAGDRYYAGIRATPYAPLVKMADRLANMHYSLTHDSPANVAMRQVYAAEMPHFVKSIVPADGCADPRLQVPQAMLTLATKMTQQ